MLLSGMLPTLRPTTNYVSSVSSDNDSKTFGLGAIAVIACIVTTAIALLFMCLFYMIVSFGASAGPPIEDDEFDEDENKEGESVSEKGPVSMGGITMSPVVKSKKQVTIQENPLHRGSSMSGKQ
jgi:hypothetical protein